MVVFVVADVPERIGKMRGRGGRSYQELYTATAARESESGECCGEYPLEPRGPLVRCDTPMLTVPRVSVPRSVPRDS